MARRRGKGKGRGKGRCSAAPKVVHPDATGVDIGAREVYAAVRPDRDAHPIRSFRTFTRELHELAKWLQRCGVTTVVMESTGVYWIPVYPILEAHGFDVQLVNAHHVRTVPGRKSDVADCEWLRYLHAVGLLRGSFRPPDAVCAVRALLRHRDGLVKTAARCVVHMQKAFQQMNVHLHHVITDVTGKTGLAITDAILAGERDPGRLADLKDRRIRADRETLIQALEADWRGEHLLALRHARQTYAHYQRLIEECDVEIEARIRSFESSPRPPGVPTPSEATRTSAPGAERFDLRAHLAELFGTNLTRIPGLGVNTVQLLFSELGTDLSRFPTAGQFASWLHLCPYNKISGARIISSRTGPGANRVAHALRWATQSAGRSDTPLGDYYRRLRARLGTPKAATATAHKLARIIYHLITEREEYDPNLSAVQAQERRRRIRRRLRKQASALGYKLVPEAV